MFSEPETTLSSVADKFCPKVRNEGEFGTRFLAETNEVFSHNAWDNVDFPPEETAIVEAKLQAQKDSAVEPSRAEELIRNPAAKWDDFYTMHENKFFMDRKWLAREAPELFESGCEVTPLRVCEVGCGVGNTTFPLLKSNPNLHINCFDYSPIAVDLVQTNPLYSQFAPRVVASVWDITKPNKVVPDGFFDFVLCIYVLSAIAPEHHATAVGNLARLLKPGGKLMVKDYGRHDLTQLRFKSGRFIAENFYCRGDDTLVYFFAPEELHDLFTAAGLRKEENFVDKRLIVNRKTQQKMYRRWMQCKYVK